MYKKKTTLSGSRRAHGEVTFAHGQLLPCSEHLGGIEYIQPSMPSGIVNDTTLASSAKGWHGRTEDRALEAASLSSLDPHGVDLCGTDVEPATSTSSSSTG